VKLDAIDALLTPVSISDKQQLLLYVPDIQAVQIEYNKQIQTDDSIVFPFWAKIWDSSIALADFLQKNWVLIQQKKVLELTAGLGLPSFIASAHAKHVICSDYVQAPLFFVDKTIEYHRFENITTQIIDCTNVPKELEVDVVLMSDIQYKPELFAGILQTIQYYLSKGVTIIITTPQRIMAKEFGNAIQPFIVHSEHYQLLAKETTIQLWVLKKWV